MCNVQKRTGTKLLAFLVTLLFAVIWIAGSGIHVSAGETGADKAAQKAVSDTAAPGMGQRLQKARVLAASTSGGALTVSFDTNGGTPAVIEPITVESGTPAGDRWPAAPTKASYVFRGWYNEREAGSEVTKDTILTQSITLYARWEKVTMTGIKAEFLGKYLMAGTNEWIDSKDLRVTAIYTDHEEQITTGYKLDDYKIVEGKNELTVRYGEYSTTVEVLGVTIKNIGVIYQGGPKPVGTTRLEYIDLNVMAELSNGEYLYKTTSYTIDPFVIHLGTNTLTVRLGGKSVSFNVTGENGNAGGTPTVVADRITAEYRGGAIRSGSYVRKSDIIVTAYFAGGSSRTVTDFTVDNYRILRGNNTITVRYGGQSASVIVVGDDTNGMLTYQVFFESQGGTAVEPMVVQADDLIMTLPVTTKQGATFQGWYTMVNGGGSRLTPVTRITQNTVYYANWSDQTIKSISANYNGSTAVGTNIVTGLTVTANYADGKSERVDNYTASKWILTEGSNRIVITYDHFTTEVVITATEGNPQTPSGGNTPGNNTNNGNTNGGTPSDQPSQTPSYYVINFHANGGKKLSKSKVTVDVGDILDEFPSVVRKNYLFKGWYTSSTGGKKISDILVPEKSMTLFARWSKVKKPAKESAPSVASKKSGQLQVKYKKISGAKGYQIGYSMKKDFSSGVKKVNTSATSKTIKNLKKGKTYYVRVRAYQVDSAGNKIYGAYSSKKRIKIKK